MNLIEKRLSKVIRKSDRLLLGQTVTSRSVIDLNSGCSPACHHRRYHHHDGHNSSKQDTHAVALQRSLGPKHPCTESVLRLSLSRSRSLHAISLSSFVSRHRDYDDDDLFTFNVFALLHLPTRASCSPTRSTSAGHSPDLMLRLPLQLVCSAACFQLVRTLIRFGVITFPNHN